MSDKSKNIAVGVFCADWRLHQPEVQIVTAVRDHLGVDALDMLVFAGPEGLVKNPERAGEREGLKNNLTVLIGAHNPTTLVFVGHQKCAGHPVSDEAHEIDVADMAQAYKDMLAFEGPIVALVATYSNDSEWGLKEVARI